MLKHNPYAPATNQLGMMWGSRKYGKITVKTAAGSETETEAE